MWVGTYVCVCAHRICFFASKSGFLLFVGVLLLLLCVTLWNVFFSFVALIRFLCYNPLCRIPFFSEKISEQEKLEELILRSQALTARKGLTDSSHDRWMDATVSESCDEEIQMVRSQPIVDFQCAAINIEGWLKKLQFISGLMDNLGCCLFFDAAALWQSREKTEEEEEWRGPRMGCK